MDQNMRNSGIAIIGDVPWGTHLCHFYQTKEDLMDILIPYFKAGLENNEFCMWVTSQPLDVEEAKEALNRSVPDFDVYLEKGQIEIIPYTHWYVKEGVFDSDRVLNGWVKKLNQALANGYDGLRLTENTFWLEKEDWNGFVDYEKELDRVLGNRHTLALCTYCLDRCKATETIDVVVNHQFALVKREGKWEQIESSKCKEIEKTVVLQSQQMKRAEDERAQSEEALRVAYEELQVQSEELQESNEALRKSKEHFRSLAENSPDIIMRFDIQNRHIYVNPAAAEAYGLSQKEIIGKTHGELERDPKQVKFWETYQEIVFATGKPEKIEFDHISPQGKKYYFDARITPELVNDKIISVLVISRDITDIKKAEAELKETLDNLEELIKERTAELEKAYNSLKESEKGLAEAQRMAHIGNWDWNIITNKLYLSDEVYSIYGCEPHGFSVTRNVFLSYIHPDDRDYVDNSFKKALNEKPINLDYRIILPGGEERVIHAQGEVICNEENIPVRTKGTIQDITENAKAKEALRLSNIYNRSLIEASLDPLVTIGHDGKIVDVNTSAESGLLVYSRDELIGTEFTNYFTEPEKVKKGYQEVFKEGFLSDYELEILHRNGRITPVLYNASVYKDEFGEVIGVFAAARDITERKKQKKS